MGAFRLGQGEVVRADMTAPARTMVFPFLELILFTALASIGVGFLDQPGAAFDPILRDAVLILWVVLAVWRFVLPLLRARRQRFVVTNHRIIVRPGRLRARAQSIPLRDVHSVRRYRRGISVAIFGHDRPLYFPQVPKAKKIEQTIGRSLPRVPARYH